MVGIIQIEEFHSGVPRPSLIFIVLFWTTFINATGHQLVSLCRSVWAEERAQILEPIVTS